MKNVQFLLDEAAMLGQMDAIDNAVGIGRGYAIRLTLFYQSLGQLKKCFPDGQDLTVLSNTSQIFFAVADHATAEHVSNRLGEHTIILESGGKSTGTNSGNTESAQPSSSYTASRNENQNWQMQARKLLKPEEVCALPPRMAITFTPGVPPICTRLIRYYEEDEWASNKTRSLKSVVAVWARLIRLVVLSVVLICAAACMTPAVIRALQSENSNQGELRDR